LSARFARDLDGVASPKCEKLGSQSTIIAEAWPGKKTFHWECVENSAQTGVLRIFLLGILPRPSGKAWLVIEHNVGCISEHSFHVLTGKLGIVVVNHNLPTLLHPLGTNSLLPLLGACRFGYIIHPRDFKVSEGGTTAGFIILGGANTEETRVILGLVTRSVNIKVNISTTKVGLRHGRRAWSSGGTIFHGGIVDLGGKVIKKSRKRIVSKAYL
jgi:hypothetical protein